MPQFDITFKDGVVVRKDARNGDLAKEAARAERVRDLGRIEDNDPRRKVTSVRELTDDDLNAAKQVETTRALDERRGAALGGAATDTRALTAENDRLRAELAALKGGQ